MTDLPNVSRLARMSHTAISALDPKRTLVLQTISPIEVHGPHLPVGQDWFEATALGEHTVQAVAAERPDWHFLIMPPLPMATDCVPHAGSVNYPNHLVRDLAFYSLRPFAKRGFARLAFSAFHGSPRHIMALEQAAADLTDKYNTAAVSLFSAVVARLLESNVFHDAVKDAPDLSLTPGQIEKDTHAGFVETSLALHLWPDLVEPGWQDLPPRVKNPDSENSHSSYMPGQKRDKSLAGKIDDIKSRVEDVSKSVNHFKENTYNGYPGAASAEFGRLMFEHLVDLCKGISLEFLDKGRAMDAHSPLWKMRKVLLSRPLNWFVDDVIKLYGE